MCDGFVLVLIGLGTLWAGSIGLLYWFPRRRYQAALREEKGARLQEAERHREAFEEQRRRLEAERQFHADAVAKLHNEMERFRNTVADIEHEKEEAVRALHRLQAQGRRR